MRRSASRETLSLLPSEVKVPAESIQQRVGGQICESEDAEGQKSGNPPSEHPKHDQNHQKNLGRDVCSDFFVNPTLGMLRYVYCIGFDK